MPRATSNLFSLGATTPGANVILIHLQNLVESNTYSTHLIQEQIGKLNTKHDEADIKVLETSNLLASIYANIHKCMSYVYRCPDSL